MKHILLTILFISMTVSLAPAKAQKSPPVCPDNPGTDLTFPEGEEFEVHAYIKETKSYEARSVKFPDERLLNITLEGISDVVPRVQKDFNLILKNPEDIVGERYKAAEEMQVLTDEELEARRGCVRR